MTKPPRAPTKPPVGNTVQLKPSRNLRLSLQTRKLLTKHYRAKHGVR